jgi:hypothetical protein
MTFQCYVPRSLKLTVVGAVFVTLDGVRHLIPDHWLSRAELHEKGRLLRLIYTFGAIEVAGQGLEVLFEDAAAGRLGIVSQAPPADAPRVQPWVSSIMALAPNEQFRFIQRESL